MTTADTVLVSQATSATPPARSGRRVGLPSVREARSAVRDTGLLLKLRWRLVRSTRAKSAIWLGAALFLGCLFVASQVGTMVRFYAEQGVGTPAGKFAVNYVIALNRGELGLIGASAVGSVIVVALFTPFAGSAMTSLVPTEDLSGLRPTRIHRYFDSVITNAASAIGFLQLVTLTGVGSLLSLDGGRPGALLFMWAVWPAVLLASVAEGWAIELAHRRFGRYARRGIAAALALGLGVAAYQDPQHGRTIFGVGEVITETVRAATQGHFAVVIGRAAVLFAVAVALFVAGLVLCRATLALPAPVHAVRAERRRVIPMSGNPNLALAQIMLAQIMRASEVRRPLLTVFFIGISAVWIGGHGNAMTTLVVAVPLSVALAFGINIFGVLGPAMSWFASQPGMMRRILVFAAAIQIAMTVTLTALIWTPATLAGRIDPGDIAAVAAGTAVSTLLTARSSADKSVKRPYAVRTGGRGDMIVPPLTAINYTLRFALWSGQIGVLVMSTDALLQTLLVAFAVAWTSLRFLRLFRYWQDRDVQSFVIHQVAAA